MIPSSYWKNRRRPKPGKAFTLIQLVQPFVIISGPGDSADCHSWVIQLLDYCTEGKSRKDLRMEIQMGKKRGRGIGKIWGRNGRFRPSNNSKKEKK